jgi:hypothetical protein
MGKTILKREHEDVKRESGQKTSSWATSDTSTKVIPLYLPEELD